METDVIVNGIIDGSIDYQNVSDLLAICDFRKKIYSILHMAPELSKQAVLLRYLLNVEMAERSKDAYAADFELEETYDYECFHWCIFLLSRVGDVSDVKLLWKAKNVDFDAYCSVDIQFLVAAGVEVTLSFLEQDLDSSSEAILNYILSCKDAGDFDDLADWYKYRYDYFLDD